MSIERKCLVISTACFTPINRNLYHELSKNLDVTLLIPKELKIGSKKHLAEILDINSAKYSVFSCKFLFGNNLRFTLIMSSFKYLKMVKPNYVILDFDPFSLISLQFIIFSFFFKFKIITLTYENRKINKLDFKNINANLIIKYIFYFLFKNLLVKKIFNVVTFNKTGQIIFINYGFNTSLTVLGVNTNIFHISNETRNLIRQSYKIKSDQVVISYFGRLVPEKGVHILLEGLSLIKHNNLVLLIDKFDTYRNDYSIKISIQLNNLSHIKVIQVDPSHEDMWKFMNATDLVILPSITTRKASTTVQLFDGQSFAIAGLIKNNVASSISMFPGLGNLPIIGALFRSSSFQTNRSELIIVVTPRIVKPLLAMPELPTDKYVEPTQGEFFIGGKLEGSAPTPRVEILEPKK